MFSIKNLVFGIAIFFLTMFVGIYGVNTFYDKAPQYDDFCNQIRGDIYFNNSADCVAAGGVWNAYQGQQKPIPAEGYCDLYYKCNQEFTDAEEKYYKKVFLITLPLGIIIIALGALVFGLEFVGAGLMFGGILTSIDFCSDDKSISLKAEPSFLKFVIRTRSSVSCEPDFSTFGPA